MVLCTVMFHVDHISSGEMTNKNVLMNATIPEKVIVFTMEFATVMPHVPTVNGGDQMMKNVLAIVITQEQLMISME